VLTTASSATVSDAVELRAFAFDPGGRPTNVKTIATLTGSSTEDPSPAFASGDPSALFLADDNVGGQGRVRWMQIAW
jgi:hypothetical protein